MRWVWLEMRLNWWAGAAPAQPPVMAKAPATQTSSKVLSILVLTQFILNLDFTLEYSLCSSIPPFPLWALVSPSVN